jgi:hypothetical protein
MRAGEPEQLATATTGLRLASPDPAVRDRLTYRRVEMVQVE